MKTNVSNWAHVYLKREGYGVTLAPLSIEKCIEMVQERESTFFANSRSCGMNWT